MEHAILLEADAIGHRYGNRVALQTASLRARAGVVLGLLGRNGAGKSTLLRCLVGDVIPDQGQVRLDGVVHDRPRRAWLARQGVCFVPDRDYLHPAATIGQQCTWIANGCGTTARIAELLETLGVSHVQQQRPKSLSGGERRRAEIACALLMEPRVLVLDEPLRGIAPIDAEVILARLRTHAREGAAVVITGHELPLLLPALDAITWCHAGRTTEFPSVSQAMESFAFRRDFLR